MSCDGVSGAGGDGDDEGMRSEPRGVISPSISGGSENHIQREGTVSEQL